MAENSLDLSSTRLAAWRGFLQAYAYILPLLEREMQETLGLPLTWYDVLVQLSKAPSGALRLQELAEAILLSQSGLTRLLDRMSDAELVERKPCPQDRRGSFAIITPQGRDTLAQAIPTHLQGIETHFLQHLDEADIQALETAFAKILGTKAKQ